MRQEKAGGVRPVVSFCRAPPRLGPATRLFNREGRIKANPATCAETLGASDEIDASRRLLIKRNGVVPLAWNSSRVMLIARCELAVPPA